VEVCSFDSIGTLCSAGTASAVTTSGGISTWSCQGSGTGATASCTQTRALCFPPESRVLVDQAGAMREIQDLKVGDPILSWDETLGAPFMDTVQAIIEHPAEDRAFVLITLEDGTEIEPTPNHPIWLEDAGHYMEAGEIGKLFLFNDCEKDHPCLHLSNYEGKALKIVDVRETHRKVQVYDVTVKGINSARVDPNTQGGHNFFVEGVRVHNKSTSATNNCTTSTCPN
jgi:hypothetical protein